MAYKIQQKLQDGSMVDVPIEADAVDWNNITNKQIDEELSTTSINPVQNKVIATELDKKADLAGATFTGDVVVPNLTATENITATKHITAIDGVTSHGVVHAEGAISTNSNLTVKGNINGGEEYLGGGGFFAAQGNTHTNGDAYIGGNTTLQGTATVNGATTINGNIMAESFGGAIIDSGNITSNEINANSVVAQQVTVAGYITAQRFGGATIDSGNITAPGSILAGNGIYSNNNANIKASSDSSLVLIDDVGDYKVSLQLLSGNNDAQVQLVAQAESDDSVKYTLTFPVATDTIALKSDIKNVTVDTTLSTTSTNPVQNKVITKEINRLDQVIYERDNQVYEYSISRLNVRAQPSADAAIVTRISLKCYSTRYLDGEIFSLLPELQNTVCNISTTSHTILTITGINSENGDYLDVILTTESLSGTTLTTTVQKGCILGTVWLGANQVYPR